MKPVIPDYDWIIFGVRVSLMVTFNASARRITLNNPESQPLPKGELLCIYTSSVAGTFTFITKSKKCPAVKTFDISQAE